ncbi:MAG: prepilin-type N-terminal cleavage/methylation domain-containing protein [Candidatus Ratteibacteria bacterium]|jgi:prepilin-type N-terminal cleavage/methylation domain-containing protein
MTVKSCKKGFTIVEVIIATIILVISLLGGVAFFSLNRNNLSYADCQRLANWTAIYKIEQLKSMDYPPTITFDPTWQYKGKTFTRTTTSNTITEDPTGNFIRAYTVSVNWGEATPPVSLTTYISEKL